MALDNQFNLGNIGDDGTNTTHTLSNLEMNVLGAYGAIKRGVSKAEALKKFKLSEKEYDDNINKCLKI